MDPERTDTTVPYAGGRAADLGVLRIADRFRLLVLTRSSFLFGALMLANVIAYVYHMLAARLLSPADYGVVVALTSVSYPLDVIVRTIQASVTKTVAGLGPARKGEWRAIYRLVVRFSGPASIAALVGVYLASGAVADFLHLSSPVPVIVLGLYVALHFLTPVPRGVLLGLGRLAQACVTIVMEPTVRLLVGVTLLAMGWAATGAIVGFAMGGAAAMLTATAMIRGLLARQGGEQQEEPKAEREGVDRYPALVLTANCCLMMLASVDQVVVTHYFPADIAGNYAVAFVLGRVILMTAVSLGVVIFTRSATMEAKEDRRAIVLVKGLVVMAGIALATLLAVLVRPAEIVRVVAGAQYGAAQSYLALVVIEMALLGLAYVQVYYHLSINSMKVIWPLGAALVLQVTLLVMFHASVEQVLAVLIMVMAVLLLAVSWLSRTVLRTNGSMAVSEAPGPVDAR